MLGVFQLEGDLSALGLREVFHGRTLRDVLPNEPVRVLVRTALARAVRSGEIEGRTGGAFDLAVTMKLGSVADGDGLEQMGVGADELNDAAVHGSDCASAELADEQATAYARRG